MKFWWKETLKIYAKIFQLCFPPFAPQAFREKWDFGMKNLETDILWTFLIRSRLLEKTISFRKDHTGELLTTLIYMPSPTEAAVGLIRPWAAVPEVAVLKCWFFNWSGRVFRGLVCKKVRIHDFLIFLWFFIVYKDEEAETETCEWNCNSWACLQEQSYDSNLKNSRCFELLLFSSSQFALGQFLE